MEKRKELLKIRRANKIVGNNLRQFGSQKKTAAMNKKFKKPNAEPRSGRTGSEPFPAKPVIRSEIMTVVLVIRRSERVREQGEPLWGKKEKNKKHRNWKLSGAVW